MSVTYFTTEKIYILHLMRKGDMTFINKGLFIGNFKKYINVKPF